MPGSHDSHQSYDPRCVTIQLERKKSCLILTYLTLVCFCGFRFFVGNDYAGYVKHFSLISIYEENVIFIEPGYYALNLLFKWSPVGYFYVFFIATALSYFFILRQLCYERILKWGIFSLVSLGCLIWMNDIIRQGIAFSIFIYSLRYMKKGDFLSYFIFSKSELTHLVEAE